MLRSVVRYVSSNSIDYLLHKIKYPATVAERSTRRLGAGLSVDVGDDCPATAVTSDCLDCMEFDVIARVIEPR